VVFDFTFGDSLTIFSAAGDFRLARMVSAIKTGHFEIRRSQFVQIRYIKSALREANCFEIPARVSAAQLE
jgi:hypothetical protein